MTMDISDTLAPNSDQLDAVDLLGASRIFTVSKVTKGKEDQPVDIHLAEFPRVYRPGKSMRRVLAACWGKDASTWVGGRMELFCDEKVQFGGMAVGGTRISRLSRIDKPKSIPLLVSRGKSAMWKVDPLPEMTKDERLAALKAEWTSADPERRAAIETEANALRGASDPGLVETPEPEPSDGAA